MHQNELVVCDKTKALLIYGHRLANSLDFAEHVLYFVENEISCGRTIDQDIIDTLLAILEVFVNEDLKALLSAEKGLENEGGFAE